MCFLVKVFFIALISIGVQAVESDRQNSGHHQAEGNGHPAVEPKNRMLTDYAFPQVKLTREDGKEVQFPAEVDDGRSVVMTFIFPALPPDCSASTNATPVGNSFTSIYAAINMPLKIIMSCNC